ncbi:MAG: ion transporter [Spirochaetes bacterium]|nr:ion transporter [Spirochaetota bacterium]
MKRKTFENFILAAIILVIIQTFLDDYSSYAGFNVSFRHFLLFTSVLFDLIFTIEFILRSIWAVGEKKFKTYLFFQRGWVDLLSSVPLLFLNSLPTLYFFLKGDLGTATASIAVLNVLKVVKAIRVTRILRLIRILKIFGKIHNAESKMAQRHTQTIATTGVFTIIMLLICFSLFKFNKVDRLIEDRIAHYTRAISNIEDINKTLDVPLRPLIFKTLSNDAHVLKMYYEDFLVFSNISADEFKKYYDYDDSITIEKKEFKLTISVSDINRITAGINLQNFIIIVFLILAYMMLYTKHFVQTVSDIVHIIRRGFSEKDYNLQIKIDENYKDDEISKLAEEYNETYLPEKLKKIEEDKTKKSTTLSMNDLMDFGKKK